MSDLFLRDISTQGLYSYMDLIMDIKKQPYYNPYCMHSDYYFVFRSIILSLLLDEKIIMLDEDLSDNEIMDLIGTTNVEKRAISLNKEMFLDLKTKSDLLAMLLLPKPNWRITLFTSGTTGVPKKISHSISALTRSLIISHKHQQAIWGFAYNPTHMAGLQVFFQALFNGNSIVRLFQLSDDQIIGEIKENEVSHLSATPTFYRLLLPCEVKFPSVIRVTSGGEKFDNKRMAQIKQMFPNAKFNNVYATTESGSLFASDGDVFEIKPNIIDKVKIKDNELYIKEDFLGESDKFLELVGGWYPTGDLVETIYSSPTKFKFLGRKTEMINIGGYKVNPAEIEDILRGIEGIVDAKVYGKKNSVLGNVVICELVNVDPTLTESEIRNKLQKKLQEYKIPRVIIFKDKLETTRTGKVKRN